MQVSKEELLKVLIAVKPGIAAKDFIEQATHAIFTGEEIATYNDSISIIYPYKTDFACSVSGEEFYKIVASIKEDTLDLTVEDNQMRIKSKKTKAGLSTIVGENAKVEKLVVRIKETVSARRFWKSLPADFLNGVYLCMFNASRDMTTGVRCCVAVKDDRIYSVDNIRISRFIMQGKVNEMLIPARSAMELVKYKVTKYGISDGWIHFKTDDEVMFNCRTMIGDYPSIDHFFREPQNEITIPMEMQEVMKAAAVIAEGDVDIAKIVEVTIDKGEITCRSEDKGKKWMEKTVDLENYKGRKIVFWVNPTFFSQVLDKSTSLFLVTREEFPDEEFPDKAIFTSGSFQHIIALPA